MSAGYSAPLVAKIVFLVLTVHPNLKPRLAAGYTAPRNGPAYTSDQRLIHSPPIAFNSLAPANVAVRCIGTLGS